MELDAIDNIIFWIVGILTGLSVLVLCVSYLIRRVKEEREREEREEREKREREEYLRKREEYFANLTHCLFCGSQLPAKGATKCPSCLEWQR